MQEGHPLGVLETQESRETPTAWLVGRGAGPSGIGGGRSRSDGSARETAGGGGLLQGLAAGEAGIQLVPVGDLGLAEPPAEIDLAAVEQAGEVAEAVVALQLDPELRQLLDVVGEVRLLGLQLGLALGQLVGVGVAGPSLAGRGVRTAARRRSSSLTCSYWRTMSATIARTSGRARLASSTVKYFLDRLRAGSGGAMRRSLSGSKRATEAEPPARSGRSASGCRGRPFGEAAGRKPRRSSDASTGPPSGSSGGRSASPHYRDASVDIR